jgi:hypothetical protein
MASFGAPILLTAGSVAQGPVLHAPATNSDKTPIGTTATLSADALLINIPVVVRDKSAVALGILLAILGIAMGLYLLMVH